jgi:hypothetical protein
MRLRYYVAMLAIGAGGVLAVAPAAQAAVTENTKVPIDLLVGIPCNGDTVELTGSLHILSSFTINNNQVSGYDHFQPQGISGTDLTTGAKYQGTGVTQDQFSSSLVNGQAQFSSVNNFKIIGQGTAPNYLVHKNTHLTFNANGTVTANVDNFTASCR